MTSDRHRTPPVVAPYGTWVSPISAEMVAAGTKPLAAPFVEGGAAYWLEGFASEGGRMALMRADPRGDVRVVTPAPFNVRTRVHEYGGGASLVADGVAYFSDFTDSRVRRIGDDGVAVVLTPESRSRYADFVLDRTRRRLVCVCEDHGAGTEPRASLVAIAIDGNGSATPRELLAGPDFLSSPRISPDGRTLAWLAWDHPRMPWEGTSLYVATLDDDGGVSERRCIAGGAAEALVQPVWSPGGVLHVVSDRTGWWNIHRVEDGTLLNVCEGSAEFGEPAWVFGQSMYGFQDEDTIVAIRIRDGDCRLVRIDAATGVLEDIPTGFSFLDDLHVDGDHVLALAASDTVPVQVVRIDARTGTHRVLATSIEHVPDARVLSRPRRIRFDSTGGRAVTALLYMPRNDDHEGLTDERPPLIVQSHGGPTTMTNDALRLGNQFWTSRGFAVLDVDYGGSSGYGRAFREALRGQFGVVDVDDCVAAARHAAGEGWVDRDRIVIRGGSASGYTTLCALAFHDLFRAGTSYFGVADLDTFVHDTHKFESHYAEFLFGPPGNWPRVFAERSPLRHVDRIDAPMIFFQGMDDRIVPPSQSEAMVRSLRARGIPVAYLAFEGEGHGFRRFETQRRVAEAELAFYARILGFVPAGAMEPLDVSPAP